MRTTALDEEPSNTEESPLLPKAQRSNAQQGDAKDIVQNDDVVEEISSRKLIWIMTSVWIGTFCAGLDASLIATIGSSIATEFHSLPLLAWLATAYLIATAATQPLAGKLTDIYSRRNGLLLSNLLFALGNSICGIAQNPTMIILGRALAGLGGGGLNTISTIIASDYVPPRRRGLWQGLSNVCWALGNGLGGVFSGFLDDVWDWRLAFLVQLPLTLASVVMIYVHVEKPKISEGASRIKRVDFLGCFLLIVTLVVFITGLNSGGNIVPWTHPLVLTALPLSAMFFCAFVTVEEKFAREPVVPVRLVLNRTVAGACFTSWFFMMIAYALDFYTVIFFRVRGLSATAAGASLIPFSITTAVGSFGAGMITNRTGKYKWLNIVTLILMLLATISIAMSSLSTPVWTTIFSLSIAGLAIGSMLIVTLLALISAVEHEEQAVVTSLQYGFRSTGSVIGVAIASAVFQNVLNSQLWSKLGQREHAADLIDRIRGDLDALKLLQPKDEDVVRESFMLALKAAFWTLVGMAFLGLASGMLMRELKLHTSLDRQDEQAEQAGESFT